MITDSLRNASKYYCLGDTMMAALKYLEERDFLGVEPGKYEIDGSKMFALVQEYESKPVEQGIWEAHRKYIDIQYVVCGREKMGYACIDSMKVQQEYDDDKDCLLLTGAGDFLTVNENCFAVFYPQDAHMPCIAADIPARVKKVIVKVPVE